MFGKIVHYKNKAYVIDDQLRVMIPEQVYKSGKHKWVQYQDYLYEKEKKYGKPGIHRI